MPPRLQSGIPDLNSKDQDEAQEPVATKTIMMSPSFTITPELVDEIIQHLPPEAHLQVRQVCRGFNNISFPYFAKAFFDGQTFLLSDPVAMGVLQEVSKRKDLVTHIETIRFSPLTLLRENLHIPPYWDPKFWEESSVLPELRWQSRRTEADEISAYGEEDQLEPRFLRHHLINALVAIFSNLQRWNKRPSILVHSGLHSSRFGEDYSGRGLKRLHQKAGPYDNICPGEDGLYVVPLYMALVKSGYATHELELGTLFSEVPLSQFSYLPQQFPVEHLRALRLRIMSTDLRYGDPLDECPIRKRHVANLIAVIARARNLQELRLSQWTKELESGGDIITYDPYRDAFLALAAKRHLDGTNLNVPFEGLIVPRLEILNLEWLVVEPELLIAFCNDRSETLKKVHLEAIGIHDMFDLDSDSIVRAIRGDNDSVVMEDCWSYDE